MRFLDLRLTAYGPFKDVRLAFEPDPLGLHVIYGANEAGKSTALRAVKGLLYGIPRDTPDAHLHRTSELRIGARLGGDNGATLEVVRRKGNQNTLLDPAEQPVDEASLRRLLHGVSEEQFVTMFGLDHDGLRRGAQALLSGRGHLGESLFEAGLGGVGLHELLSQLRGEAEGIFTPQASKRPLNLALRSFSEAQKRSRDGALPAEAWLKQKQVIEERSHDLVQLEAQGRTLAARARRLERAKRALPLLGRRRQLVVDRAGLGDVTLLPETAARDREEALRARDEAASGLARLEPELTQLAARRAALRVPEALLAEEAPMRAVQERYGGIVDAVRDLPRLRAELDGAAAAVRALGRQLGRDEAGFVAIDAATQARVKKLAMDARAVSGEHDRARRAEDEARRQLDEAHARLAALPVAVDAAPLRAAIERVQRHGDLEVRRGELVAERDKLALAVTRLEATLGLWSGAREALPGLALPSAETVAAQEQALAALDREGERLDEQLEAERRKRAAAQRELEALRREGAPPTEDDLQAARAERDRLWANVRRGEAFDAYEAATRAADALADRLRHEAREVAQLARLVTDEQHAAREVARLEGERAALAGRQAAAEAAWTQVWAPAGIRPLSPAEMRAWLLRHAALAQKIEALEDVTRDSARVDALIAAARADLARLTGHAGDLGALLERAAAQAGEADAQARARRELETAIERLGREVDARTHDREARAAEVQAWRDGWTQVTAALGLPATATPEEATAVLELQADGVRSVDKRDELARRVAAMERDLDQYATEIGRLAQTHAPSLASLPVEQAAAQLIALHGKARADRAERDGLDAQLAAAERQRAELAERRARAEARLNELLHAAGVTNLGALELAERRSQTAQGLDRELREKEAHLANLADGAPLAALEAELKGLDLDQIDAQLEQLEAEVRSNEDERNVVNQQIGSYRAQLQQWDQGSSAAEAATEAQEHLARARGFCDRWLKLKLAEAVLARQVERYREANQGPILTRASELFRRLTLGGYGGLKPAFDDKNQPVLSCVRKDGREVPVDGLSDGTRDQLYLSLRLATLERHARANEPMPLVVDDILIHFDDDRAQASLAVLGELSERMQVLFFTHHARLLELAHKAVPKMREHRLP